MHSDSDDASTHAATTTAYSDIVSDLDDLDSNMISTDDVEEETLPINNSMTEEGDVEDNANATSAGDREIEDSVDMRPFLEVHQSIMDDAHLEDF